LRTVCFDVQLIAFDEDANEIAIQELADRMSARGLSSIEPGETHDAQMLIEGPLRGSGVIDGIFSLRTSDWEFQAEAAGRERGREPSSYKQKSLTVTEGTHRFVRGLKASHLALVSSEE
jgi:hypothetical protein